MRRIAFLLIIPLLVLVPARANALTVRDIVELTRAGLGEDVLLALIEVDPSVFPIDAASIKRLKEEGVSERVIIAMVRSARAPSASEEIAANVPAAPPVPAPQVVVIEHHDPPEIREVQVAVPVYVPYFVQSTHRVRSHEVDRASAVSIDRPGFNHGTPVKQPEPVYWGFGGKLRPDAWKPVPEPDVKKRQN